VQKDFYNSIGTKRASQHVCALSALRGKADISQRFGDKVKRSHALCGAPLQSVTAEDNPAVA
jgi:hypothetical protein